MSTRNASPSALGWDFQINSAILLMLENIKEAKHVRVEGADEDIEITLKDNKKIYAQAKSVVKPDNTSHVIDKLSDALGTLSQAAKKGDGVLFTYVTNSSNPFNDLKTISFFTGRTHLNYSELPSAAQEKIKIIINNKGYGSLDLHKLDIRVIPFYGDDLKNRYKEIRACVNEFLSEINVDFPGINTEIMSIWQKNLFQNATQTNTRINLSKEKIIWPLIVLVVDKCVANNYKQDFCDDEIDEIEKKYRLLINHSTLNYGVFSQIISDFKKSRKTTKQFITDNWINYQNIVGEIEIDESIRESLIKIILYRIITQKKYIQDIKKGSNL